MLIFLFLQFYNFDSPDQDYLEKVDKITTMTWMNNWLYAKSKHFPTKNFRGQMAIPRNLYLIENSKEIISQFAEGEIAQYELISKPTYSVADLRIVETSIKIEKFMIKSKDLVQFNMSSLREKSRLDIEVSFLIGNDQKNLDFGFEIFANPKRTEKTTVGLKILPENSKSELYFDRTHSGIRDFDLPFSIFSKCSAPLSWPANLGSQVAKKIKLRILVDVSSIEVFLFTFIGEDEHPVQSRTLTNLVFPKDPESLGLNLFSNNGNVFVEEISIFELKPTIPL